MEKHSNVEIAELEINALIGETTTTRTLGDIAIRSISTLRQDSGNHRGVVTAEMIDSRLVADIRANGIRNPLIITGSGVVIVGNRRLMACQLAGVESAPCRVCLDGDVDYWRQENALSLGLAKAQLQRAIIAHFQAGETPENVLKATLADIHSVYRAVSADAVRQAKSQALTVGLDPSKAEYALYRKAYRGTIQTLQILASQPLVAESYIQKQLGQDGLTKEQAVKLCKSGEEITPETIAETVSNSTATAEASRSARKSISEFVKALQDNALQLARLGITLSSQGASTLFDKLGIIPSSAEPEPETEQTETEQTEQEPKKVKKAKK